MISKITTKDFDLIQRDGRRKMIMIIDVETAGDITKGQTAVYDLGFAVCDKQGRIYYKRNFIIKEIFDNLELMATAYYAKKIPLYIEMLRTGKAEKVSLKQAIDFLVACINEYCIDIISAYNLGFDTKAMKYTLRTFLPDIYKVFDYKNSFTFWEVAILRKPIQFICIWSLFCQTIAQQKSYARMAIKYNGVLEENDWISEKGNIRTNAQCAYRYISNNFQFMEEHTALSDVEIELQIMAKSFRQHKKFDKSVFYFPWRLCQDVFQDIYNKEVI